MIEQPSWPLRVVENARRLRRGESPSQLPAPLPLWACRRPRVLSYSSTRGSRTGCLLRGGPSPNCEMEGGGRRLDSSNSLRVDDLHLRTRLALLSPTLRQVKDRGLRFRRKLQQLRCSGQTTWLQKEERFRTRPWENENRIFSLTKEVLLPRRRGSYAP